MGRISDFEKIIISNCRVDPKWGHEFDGGGRKIRWPDGKISKMIVCSLFWTDLFICLFIILQYLNSIQSILSFIAPLIKQGLMNLPVDKKYKRQKNDKDGDIWCSLGQRNHSMNYDSSGTRWELMDPPKYWSSIEFSNGVHFDPS